MYRPATNVLYCGGLVSEQTDPWFAFPVELYLSGEIECGHRFCVEGNGERHCGDARDAGEFGRFCVRQLDGTCLPIAADIPEPHWWGGSDISMPARVWNVTEVQRVWEGFRD
jgi:hypothetical protein